MVGVGIVKSVLVQTKPYLMQVWIGQMYEWTIEAVEYRKFSKLK